MTLRASSCLLFVVVVVFFHIACQKVTVCIGWRKFPVQLCNSSPFLW